MMGGVTTPVAPPTAPPAPPAAAAAVPTATEAPFGGLAPTVTLEDVELCRVGQWNASTGGVQITPDVLRGLAEASRDADADHVPIHPGHVDPRFPALSDGEPAMGWVQNVRVQGDRLVGDLANVPARLAAIIPKAFRRRSIEIAANVRRPDGTVRPYALHGLGLLGVEMPAVKGLADVTARYSTAPALEGTTLLLSDELTPPPAPLEPTNPTPTAPKERPVPRIPDDRLRALAGLAADADVSRLQAELVGTYEAGDPAAPGTPGTPGVPATAPTPTGTPAPATASTPPTTPGANLPTQPTAPDATSVPALATVGAGASLSAADGEVRLSAAQWAGIESLIRDQHTARTEGTLAAALSAGRISPAEAPGWREHLLADEARTTALLALLPTGRVPVTELGSTGHANLSAHQAAGEEALLSFEASLGLDLPGRTPAPAPTTQGA